mmetsp:Transcript_22389/g.16869  ORF Transcript_22389/g.16869 Transcript_22389/m.16869 type:complete len:130 (+) Transcript_22389:695-1084(+)
MDVDFHNGRWMCVLLDKNEVCVFDLQTRKSIFRASFIDATEQIVKLFYVASPKEDEAEEEKASDFFQGHFLFAQIKIVKQDIRSPAKVGEMLKREIKQFKNLSLAEMKFSSSKMGLVTICETDSLNFSE